MKRLMILIALTGLISCATTKEIKQEPARFGKSYSEQKQDLSKLRAAALSGNREAQVEIGILYYDNDADVAQDYTEALKWLLMAAQQGDPTAEYYVGLMYQNGQGTKKDDLAAERWTRLAAEAGEPAALWSMGMIYCNGWGVPVNQSEGEKWFIRWAERGGGHEKFSMGEMYAAGRMLPQDAKKAVYWYEKAAELGYETAKVRLKVIHAAENKISSGESGWTKQLAESGDAESEYRTGINYEQAQGFKKDYKNALYWFRKAADKGHLGAMSEIALLYADGMGVERSDAIANMWWQKAAEKGDDTAITFLTWQYRDGTGLPRNYYKAYLWCSLRGWQYGRGKSVDKECADIALKLSPEQINKAQEEAAKIRSRFQSAN